MKIEYKKDELGFTVIKNFTEVIHNHAKEMKKQLNKPRVFEFETGEYSISIDNNKRQCPSQLKLDISKIDEYNSKNTWDSIIKLKWKIIMEEVIE